MVKGLMAVYSLGKGISGGRPWSQSRNYQNVKSVPEKGRDTTECGRARGHTRRNHLGRSGSVSYPSNADTKELSCLCRPEIRCLSGVITVSVPCSTPTDSRGAVLPTVYCRYDHLSRKPGRERSDRPGTWRWVGAEGFRVDGYGGLRTGDRKIVCCAGWFR